MTDSEERNAFLPPPLQPPLKALILGRVPDGNRTLAECAQLLSKALENAINPDRAELLGVYEDFNIHLIRELAAGLFEGDLQAKAVFSDGPQVYRVPVVCWASVAAEVMATNSWNTTRLVRIAEANCMFGPEFGVYDGKTPFVADEQIKAYVEACAARARAKPELRKLIWTNGLGGSDAAHAEQALNVPVGRVPLSRWIVLPEVGTMAATRLARRGEDTEETSIRAEIARMLKDQGKSFASIGQRRSDAGYKVR